MNALNKLKPEFLVTISIHPKNPQEVLLSPVWFLANAAQSAQLFFLN